MLKDLCCANGVSGDEDEVRDLIIEQLKKLDTSYSIDKLGNIVAFKPGSGKGRNIMLAAHMDEVGLIITHINPDGYLKFKPVGGIDSRVLLGKRVLIGKRRIPGVIGIKAIHLQKPDERKRAVEHKDLYIDIGTTSDKEAQKLVELGDYACFENEYLEFGNGLVSSKALDDRAGCGIILELLKNSYEHNIFACFTVMEELGCRGAGIVARRIQPSLAVVVETTTCSDVPFCEPSEYVTVMNQGPALSIMDRGTLYDKEINNFFYSIAQKHKIKVQYKQSIAGGNDSSAIHLESGGIKTVAVSVPCRYLHSPVSVISVYDYHDTIILLGKALKELGDDF